ncbi:MAG: PIN domain-containing protein, partial [Thermodesulfovibrionales bacterium]|nr:PIN domain-containing protein [Thermodesulfovibrionales bacterium]
MGLVEEVKGKTICIDTSVLIYFIERHLKYYDLLKSLFTEISVGNVTAITSTITLLEVLVFPLRNQNTSLANKYRDILLYS